MLFGVADGKLNLETGIVEAEETICGQGQIREGEGLRKLARMGAR